MDYVLKNCTVCGSERLKKIDSFVEGGDRFETYTCLSCGEKLTSKSKLYSELKSKELKASREAREKTEQERKFTPSFSSADRNSDAAELYKTMRERIVLLTSSPDDANYSYGTGFIVSKDGYVFTNAHVVINRVKSSNNLAFNLNEDVVGEGVCFDGAELSVISVDVKRDLALLKLDLEREYPFVRFAKSDSVSTGDTVYALGNSKGKGLSFTHGIVSDAARMNGGLEYVLTDVAVNGGNSGGPLVNENGLVVGVITSHEVEAVGMSYAIPSSAVIAFIEKVAADEETEIKIEIE